MRGVLHPALDYPEMPHVFTPIILTYRDLENYSFQEIKAYCEMMEIRLDAFDIELLKDLNFVRENVRNGATVKQVMEAFGWQI